MKIVLYVLDGLQVDALNSIETPESLELKKRAVLVEQANTIYPSLTGPGHASILTGLLPSSHGLISHMYWDFRKGLKNIYSDSAFQSSTLFELLAQKGIKSAGHGNYFRRGISDGAKKRFLKWMANKLERASFVTNALEAMPVVERYLKKSVAGTLKNVQDKVVNSNATVHYILDNSTDKASHKYGPLSSEYHNAIEKGLCTLLDLINALDSKGEQYVVFVTSDHGHTTVDSKLNAQDMDLGEIGLPILKSKVINANLILEYGQASTEAVCVIVSRHVQVYLKDKSKTKKVAECLLKKGFFDRLLIGEEIEKIGVSNKRTGDIIGSLKDDFGFVEMPIGVKGDHGGFTQKEMNVPLWILGNKIVPQKIKRADVIDIAPTIFALLGLNGAKFDGSAIKLYA
ncbi:hypothetical protein B9Q11_00190 [Candidatus Marsarchaeota G2 archaeon ECH_B_SAG-F08]|jgi:Uncharacterized proteins of the AP superfamily|uniref:Alkaline phosphatase family protein n=3 Tax=Candidatus Marsarchaeota TaxID=1978152 RepID=A0A2R6C3V1_9ARCH|nr:MAG: hypothetical protein B9Q02_07125 [Candidatus Marsarchaeota G1 archaeon BE_D]PSO00282.1 MAG: hypothetical protein B9Q11_00190 [Candidatus Marsarchaeota G2 archaeon ECH_B_SAG-F08]PSO05446.1 MAG: hypothetical protein B9Q12_00455 [Candidatus Marsarchaeota G2 archaeon ECH_B_SAG-G06]